MCVSLPLELPLYIFRPDTSSECGNCVPTINNWQENLLSDESIAEQIAVLQAVLCPAEADETFCEDFIPFFWPLFAGTVYPVFLDGEQVCYNQVSEHNLLKQK